jgi:C-22 sterol desaturase
MIPVRDFNMEVSLKVFCGPHIPQHAVKEISRKYWQITKSLELVNFPLALPGTKIYGAIQARKYAMKYLVEAAEKSKAAMAAGAQVECLIDEWAQGIMAMQQEDAAATTSNNSKTKRDFSAHEIAQVVLSFLFASQDAMSSGIVYMFQHFADHPDVLAKVREEQMRVREGDSDKPMSLEMLDDMPYLRATVRESLRVKPPVTMVCLARSFSSDYD